MSIQGVEVLGDAVEVLGVFFLSVEAIKVPNLLKLRDKLLLPLQHALHPTTIQFTKMDWTREELQDSHRSLRRFFFSHLGAGVLATTLLVLVIARVTPRFRTFMLHQPANAITAGAAVLVSALLISLFLIFVATGSTLQLHPLISLFVCALNPLIWVPMLLGEVCHQLSQWLVRKAIALVQFIDQNTPTGSIGILGFVLVCLGKVVKVLARL